MTKDRNGIAAGRSRLRTALLVAVWIISISGVLNAAVLANRQEVAEKGKPWYFYIAQIHYSVEAKWKVGKFEGSAKDENIIKLEPGPVHEAGRYEGYFELRDLDPEGNPGPWVKFEVTVYVFEVKPIPGAYSFHQVWEMVWPEIDLDPLWEGQSEVIEGRHEIEQRWEHIRADGEITREEATLFRELGSV